MSASQTHCHCLPMLQGDIWHSSSISRATHLRLIFEGSDIEGFEVSIPLISGHNIKKLPVQRRPFTSTSEPFPFDVSTTFAATPEQWLDIAKAVYDWLSRNVADRHTDEWRWALNYFWICYVGATPNFPFDKGKPKFQLSPDIAPLAGEFMMTRYNSKTLEGQTMRETAATLIHRLVEWLNLKDKWVSEGVCSREFQRISRTE